MMQKKTKKILYIIGGLIILLAAALWVFATFYLDDALSAMAIPRFEKIIRIVTHGRYQAQISKITHSDGNMYCYDLKLIRQHYDTSETGITVERLLIDTLQCLHVSWWNLIVGKDLTMSGMKINAPKIFFTDAAKQKHTPDVIKDTIEVPPLTISNLEVKDIHAYLPGKSAGAPSFRGMNVHLSDFYLDPAHPKKQSLLFCKHADFSLPEADFLSPSDSFYKIHVRNMHGNTSDSSLSIESLSYTSRYNDEVYAQKHRYATARINLGCSKIHIFGIHLAKLLSGESIECQRLAAGSWFIDSYVDRKRPADPHPKPVKLPNEMLHDMKIGINMGEVILDNGLARIRERSGTSGETGMLYFDRVHLDISPLSTISSKPVVMNSTAYFVGQALLKSTWIYPLKRKSFDMVIHATVGGFDAKRLNTWLVPFERTQVTDGSLDNGQIEMKIVNGLNTTTVTPRYRNLKMRVLPQDTSKSSGITEGFKSFMASAFVVRSDNFDEQGKPAISATTTLQRTPDEELMQFIWISLRKSLGQVVGGFK